MEGLQKAGGEEDGSSLRGDGPGGCGGAGLLPEQSTLPASQGTVYPEGPKSQTM